MSQYNRPMRVLHWVSAAVILWALAAGFSASLLNLPLALKSGISFINVSLTFIFIPVFILRCIVRLSSTPPSNPHMHYIARRLAAIGHFFLYSLTFLVLVTGVLMMDTNFSVFGLFGVPRFVYSPSFNYRCHEAHVVFSVTLSFCVVGHILAVIFHEFNNDKVIARMALR